MIYFTSDLHLGHNNILKFTGRPYDSMEEMNRELIRNINFRVTKNDWLYILGDVSHHILPEQTNQLLARINGRKVLVRGNHDKEYDPALFEEICDYKKLFAYGKTFILSHYPFLSWDRMAAGSLMLHGNIHSTGEYNEENRADGLLRYDVRVDANGLRPVSAYEVLEFFGLR